MPSTGVPPQRRAREPLAGPLAPGLAVAHHRGRARHHHARGRIGRGQLLALRDRDHVDVAAREAHARGDPLLVVAALRAQLGQRAARLHDQRRASLAPRERAKWCSAIAARGGDVERVGAGRHRDRHAPLDPREHRRGEPAPLAAEPEREAPRRRALARERRRVARRSSSATFVKPARASAASARGAASARARTARAARRPSRRGSSGGRADRRSGASARTPSAPSASALRNTAPTFSGLETSSSTSSVRGRSSRRATRNGRELGLGAALAHGETAAVHRIADHRAQSGGARDVDGRLRAEPLERGPDRAQPRLGDEHRARAIRATP